MDEIPTSAPVQTPPTPPVNDIEENKDIAALGYAWILSIFVYYWKKDSPFVRFHAKQGIVLFILSILVWIVPVAGRFLELLVLALMVLGFLGAAQGQWKDLPIIGDMASGRWSHVRQSWKDVVQSIAKLWRRFLHFLHKEKQKASASTPVDVPPPFQSSQPQSTNVVVDVTPVQPDTAPNQPQSEPEPPSESSSPSNSSSL